MEVNMPKTTVDELIADARRDALFDVAYTTRRARIRRALGDALFAIRKCANLTPAELAERAGLHKENASRLELGDLQVVDALEGLEAVANAGGTSILVLFVDRQTGQERARVLLGG
jgi:hypothetical protein